MKGTTRHALPASPLESFAFAALAAAAAVLVRLLNCQHLGLAHWDEGVYAVEARAFAMDLIDGFRHIAPDYAPPLFPLLASLACRVLGVHDIAAILVSAVAGGAAVGVVFWVLDRRVGRRAAWAGALVLAACPLHLFYSRMALTDATFALFYTLGFAVAAGRLEGERAPARLWRSGAVLGLITGLALSTKYHGAIILLSATFFELACLAAQSPPLARLAGAWRPAREWPRLPARWGATLGSLALAWLVAGCFWLPWKLFVNARFGDARMHMQHQFFAKGWARTLDELPPYLLMLVATLALWAAVPAVGGLAGLRRAAAGRERWPWIAAGWVAAYLAALANYTYFIRLTLPLVPLLALLAGLGAEGLFAWGARGLPRRSLCRLAAGLLAIFMAAQAWRALSHRSDGYRRLGDRVSEILPALNRPGGPRLVTQLIPPMVFYQPDWPTGQLLGARAPLGAYGRRFYLLLDYSAYRLRESRRMLFLWRPWMRRVAAFPNECQPPAHYNPVVPHDLAELFGLARPPTQLADFELYEVVIPEIVPI